jgi:hypothetical protein
MVDQDRTGTEPAHSKVLKAVPVTPSEGTERAEGLPFGQSGGPEKDRSKIAAITRSWT